MFLARPRFLANIHHFLAFRGHYKGVWCDFFKLQHLFRIYIYNFRSPKKIISVLPPKISSHRGWIVPFCKMPAVGGDKNGGGGLGRNFFRLKAGVNMPLQKCRLAHF